MIRGFTDHSANARTFLAWVRTGIAVTAFGFLVERLKVLPPAPDGLGIPLSIDNIFAYPGFASALLGMAVIVITAIRFVFIRANSTIRNCIRASARCRVLPSLPCSRS